ncbi:ectoine/hydroxyectoine ABC transporter permease subunit EhuD [Streptomonospora wellingtoniae]|uniref:Ectoine/hydroxyectoine ABC transporter permease subunit EhuD n=1 Tax=Streptomonospora wellingtoniae TaxID=3075544 RepID=A0ABU2KYI4_9ACTN|nr:ectoine/hydroxyectoine ABC transporter permease subunit EhuD [Streptomonospora sp. DSM 45055]MDT0304370.1 ectoine/hydroxyectoine ABC transporter permease subunit EhuD [Streptomonospora sp. DSM 45055]
MNWDTEFAIGIIPQLLQGLVVTIQATVIGYVVALILGLLVAVLRRVDYVGPVVFAVFEFIRTTPLLVQLLFVFALAPPSITPLTIGITVMGVHYAAYTAEVYRSGIEGVAKGQWEACRALSLPPIRVWGAVVLPQAIRKVIPALGNYLISMFKDTPYLFAITVPEMMFVAKAIGTESFRSMEAYTLAGLFFLAVSIPSAVIIRRLERRYAAV